jgi:hypothetical protein
MPVFVWVKAWQLLCKGFEMKQGTRIFPSLTFTQKTQVSEEEVKVSRRNIKGFIAS